MNNETIIPVPGRLNPIAKDRVLAGTDVIYDDYFRKTQAEINAGLDEIISDKVSNVVQESTVLSETIDSKIDGKVPTVVTQALNEAVMPAVQEAVQGVQNQVTALQEQVDNLQPGTSTDNNTTYKISLNGEVKGDSNGIDLGTVYAPTTAGTIGKYLKSTGNGAPVWADIPTSEGGLSQMQVEQMINQEVYKQGTKPANVDNVTSANILEEWEDAVSDYDQSHIGGGSILAPFINLELYGSSVKPAGVEIVTTENLKYGKVDYTISKVNSEGGAVSVDATIPVHEITATGNISGITFTAGTVPEDGHSCHIIIKSSSKMAVVLAHNATMSTIDGTMYKASCPKSKDITLNISAGGYVEFDLFRIGNAIYVRGI